MGIRLLFALGCLLAACRTLPGAPPRPQDDQAFAAPEPVLPPGMEEAPPAADVLLPGDVLALKTLSVAPLDAPGLVVDSSGALHVPLGGAVAVAGLSLEGAAAKVEQALRPYDRTGRVLLTLTEPAGHRVTVAGQVKAPGSYPLRPGARVADLVLQAGGPERVPLADGGADESADLAAARIVRGGQALPVSVARALEGDARHNVRLQAGDAIYVPPLSTQRLTVLGRVAQGRSLPYRRGIRLSDALGLAGGPVLGANLTDIRVIRGELSRPRVYRANFADLLEGRATDVLLAPGDVVFVTETWFASAADVIQRLSPLLVAGALANSVLR